MEFICYADWHQLPASANQLFEEHARSSIFFSRPWFESLEKVVLDDEQTMLLACVVEGEEVLAILPLMIREHNHLHSLKHFYSSLFTLLLAKHNQKQVLNCLVSGFDQMSINSLRLDPVAEDDRNVQMLQQVMESMGYECHRHFRFYNWIYRVKGQTYNDYMATRPSRVRNTITRKQRKLLREHGYEIRLYTNKDLEQGLKDYNSVYQASWKAHEQFDAFIYSLTKTLSKSGWLRLAVLYIGEQPAAAQYWFVAHGKASIFKLVYDEIWKQYSPGSILISYMMQLVIEIDKVEEIDFLTGNDAYKQDWMSERRQRWMLSLFKPLKPKGLVERLAAPLKTMFLTN